MADAYDGRRPRRLMRPRSPIWGPLAHAGVARAQNNVGACFAEGLGVARDLALALRWLTLAAEAGDPVGQRNLAALYFKGEGVDAGLCAAPPSSIGAAAEQGDGPAQDMLSWMLLEGEVIAARCRSSAALGRSGRRAGHRRAMTRLGMIFHNALGVERDRRAGGAMVGDAPPSVATPTARRCSGAALHLGAGVARDGVAALAWLLRARTGGSALAAAYLRSRARDAVAGRHRGRRAARRRCRLPEATP